VNAQRPTIGGAPVALFFASGRLRVISGDPVPLLDNSYRLLAHEYLKLPDDAGPPVVPSGRAEAAQEQGTDVTDTDIDRTEIEKWDPGFTERVMVVVRPIVKRWFRSEVRGLELRQRRLPVRG